MQSRQDIKLQAKESFYPNYWITVGAVFITYALISAASGVTFLLAVWDLSSFSHHLLWDSTTFVSAFIGDRHPCLRIFFHSVFQTI